VAVVSAVVGFEFGQTLARQTQASSRPEVVLDPFTAIRYLTIMPDEPHLRPATPDEIAQSLAFALQYSGRRRVHDGAEAMARITADRLVQHLQQSGFVLMKRSPRPAPTTSRMPSSGAAEG
jgi:hypothetical protein